MHKFVCNYIVRGSWTIQSNMYVWGWYMLVWQIYLRYSTLQVLGCRHKIAEYSWHKFIELRKMYALVCGFKQTCFCFIPTNGVELNWLSIHRGGKPHRLSQNLEKGKIHRKPSRLLPKRTWVPVFQCFSYFSLSPTRRSSPSKLDWWHSVACRVFSWFDLEANHEGNWCTVFFPTTYRRVSCKLSLQSGTWCSKHLGSPKQKMRIVSSSRLSGVNKISEIFVPQLLWALPIRRNDVAVFP